MSKLDSGLFVMTPVDVQLDSIARDAVKMFEGEAKSVGIDLQFRLEDSCKTTAIQHVSLDPTRVLQILIVSHHSSSPSWNAPTNCPEPDNECDQIHETARNTPNLCQFRYSRRAADPQC